MKLPFQAAPVYRYNACTPGRSPIGIGVNPAAISFIEIMKCALECHAGMAYTRCLPQCGRDTNCLANCAAPRLSHNQSSCMGNCLPITALEEA